MVFENQHPGRKAQNMAALLAIVILLGILLPIPLGANLGDWLNEQNAPTNIDTKYAPLADATFNLTDTGALYTATGYKPLFTWHNHSDNGNTNEVNVTMVDGVLTTEDRTSIDDNQVYNLSAADPDYPDWDNGEPTWTMFFNITAKEMYADGVVQIGMVVTSPNTANAPNEVTDGKALLSFKDKDYDTDEYSTVTYTLSAGGVELKAWKLTSSGNGKIDENFTVSTDLLRQCIIAGGDTSFLKLEVKGHDIRDIDMTGSGIYTYNAVKQFSRDDGLVFMSLISIIVAAIGIFLVQPKYNLPIGQGRGRGRRF